MGRELRRVPITNTLAAHPRRGHGYYADGVTPKLQPMFDETYGQAIDEWIADYEKWKARTYHLENTYAVGDHRTIDELYAEPYWEYAGGPPDPAYYRPPHPEGVELGIQFWEITTEGTPQSEVYPDTEQGLRDLCEWVAVNCTTFASFRATADEWYQMLSDGLVTATDPDLPGVMFI